MEMLKPELSLTGEPDGEFTLLATTLTPNSCFSSGGATMGAPEGHVVIPETLAVTLHIFRSGNFCLQAVTPVRHRLPDLRVGGSSGKSSVLAFTVAHDLDSGGSMVVGHNAINVPDAGATTMCGSGDRSRENAEQWHAIANLKPPAPFTLFVNGRIWVPTPGHRVTLKPAVPQGINPGQLILDLSIEALSGFWPEVLTEMDATYLDENYSDDRYESVLIRASDGASWQVNIRKVF